MAHWRKQPDGSEWCFTSDAPVLAERLRSKGGRLIEEGFEYHFDSNWPNMIIRKASTLKKATTRVVESKHSRTS